MMTGAVPAQSQQRRLQCQSQEASSQIVTRDPSQTMSSMPELAAAGDSPGLDLTFVVEHVEPRRAPPSRATLPAADHQRSATSIK